MLILFFGVMLSFAEPIVLAFEEPTTVDIERYMPPIPSDSKVLKMSVAEMKKKLQEFRVLPDLIDETPKLPMMVEWIEEEAEFGNYIERYIIKLAPFWVEWKCEKYELHTVMMLGLDEPSATNPYLRQYQFWIMGNVEGFHVIIGEELTAWLPPRPANGSGPHRYVFLVYRQPQKLDFMEYHLTETIKLEGLLFVGMLQKPWKNCHDGSIFLALCIFISAPLLVSNEEVLATEHPLKYTPEKIKAALEEHKIIPDALDVAPEKGILIEWVEGPKAVFGNILEPSAVLREPYWVKWDADVATRFTLMMFGLDEPSKENHKLREWQLFWLVGNIPEYSIRFGDAMTYYLSPKPPEDSGIHRYVVLLYLQPNGSKIEFEEKKNPIFDIRDDKVRGNWSHAKFAEKYELGNPIACNFFRVQWVKTREDNDTHVV